MTTCARCDRQGPADTMNRSRATSNHYCLDQTGCEIRRGRLLAAKALAAETGKPPYWTLREFGRDDTEKQAPA